MTKDKDVYDSKNPWLAPAIVLAAGLIAVSLISVNASAKAKKELVIQKNDTRLARVNSAQIYQDFVCSCCGQNIAECTCGMAAERRRTVAALAAKGLSKRDIYKEMVKKYTEEILFNEALAAEIKEELIAEAPTNRPVIEISPNSIDAGEVSMAAGKVETIYKVTNSGKSDLKISGMETSCMCTTAILKKKKETSPVFGMHDNPTDWSLSLKPGEEAQLVVIFDPNAHGPEATGPVTRTITVVSNDVIDSAKKIRFEAEVVK